MSACRWCGRENCWRQHPVTGRERIDDKGNVIGASTAPEPQPVPGPMPWPRPECTEQLPCGGCFTRGICDQLMWDSGRARGIEDGKRGRAERAAQIINDLIDGREPITALALLEARNAIIADAIAKETP